MGRTYLTVIGDRVALAWVLTSGRMAFPATRRPEIEALEKGDELLLLTTRGCFRNPTRDRTRVIGLAVLRSAVTKVDQPIELIGRTFDRVCDIESKSLAPVLSGVELAPLVERLDAFPNKSAWSMWLRRPLLALPPGDANRLRTLLDKVAIEPDQAIPGYIELGRESLAR